jgi:hypothetical protein
LSGWATGETWMTKELSARRSTVQALKADRQFRLGLHRLVASGFVAYSVQKRAGGVRPEIS